MSDERAQMMARLYNDGMAMEAIGVLFGVSRERVRQLINLVAPAEHGARQRIAGGRVRERYDRDAAERTDLLIAAYRETFNVPLAAKRAGIGHQRAYRIIRERIGPMERKRLRGEAMKRGAATDAELLDALRRAAAVHGGALTGWQFDAWAKANGVVGHQSVIIRFGSWTKACDLAGIASHSTGGGGPKLYDEQACSDAVRTVWRIVGHAPSVGEYERHRVAGMPSCATVRNRLGKGNWLPAIERVPPPRS